MKFRFGSLLDSSKKQTDSISDSAFDPDGILTEQRSLVRKSIVFHGDVQGVGFRWRAKEAANILGLTGWVRNEYDGTVSMEVQGTEEGISRMIGMVDEGSFVHIEDMEVTRLSVHEGERSFRIEGYGY